MVCRSGANFGCSCVSIPCYFTYIYSREQKSGDHRCYKITILFRCLGIKAQIKQCSPMCTCSTNVMHCSNSTLLGCARINILLMTQSPSFCSQLYLWWCQLPEKKNTWQILRMCLNYVVQMLNPPTVDSKYMFTSSVAYTRMSVMQVVFEAC